MGFIRYGDILKNNSLACGTESMKKTDISNLSAYCILILIIGAETWKIHSI